MIEGVVGNGYRGDIAVDDISIRNGDCPNTRTTTGTIAGITDEVTTTESATPANSKIISTVSITNIISTSGADKTTPSNASLVTRETNVTLRATKPNDRKTLDKEKNISKSNVILYAVPIGSLALVAIIVATLLVIRHVVKKKARRYNISSGDYMNDETVITTSKPTSYLNRSFDPEPTDNNNFVPSNK